MFAHLKTLDTRSLDVLDVDALAQPFEMREDTVEGPEVMRGLELKTDPAHVRRPTRRTCVDFRANPHAFAHLEHLPPRGSSLHGVIGGRYGLWDLVPGILERTGKRIRHLYVATLSFSRQNAADLLALLDAGRIRRVTFLISSYFKATSEAIYDTLIPPLLARGQRVLAFRTHCKLILAELADGRKFAVESSANLRSCKNVETFVMSQDAKLFAFHRAWIEGLIAERDTRNAAAPRPPAAAVAGFESKARRATRKRGARR